MPQRIVTLLTDYGWNDYYVGAIKGVILEANPEAQIVDVSHGVAAYDVLDAAFTLAQTYKYFPANTVHMVVVDPGVGTQRRPIVARGDKHYFLAPDNGVLSFVYAEAEMLSVYEITSTHYFKQPVSHTFHGRDIFAACAGWLSKGVDIEKFGGQIEEYVKITVPKAQKTGDKQWKGMVLKIDRFSSVITNISAADCPELFADPTPAFKVTINGKAVSKMCKTYAEGAKGEIFAILGSSGYLELSANKAGAAQGLDARRGTEIVLDIT